VEDLVKIPMFPLTIFPLPGELVPLHIFEPRYRQLLQDAETKDISFGIYFNHVSNLDKLGSSVTLESIIKRYPGGESDVIVKCTDLFEVNTLFRTHRDRLYPGGEVRFWKVDITQMVDEKLAEAFVAYLSLINIVRHDKDFSSFQIATELNLDFEERLKFVRFDEARKESFLLTRLNYQAKLLDHADKAKDIFHLN
jgi:Lon protease-like protein